MATTDTTPPSVIASTFTSDANGTALNFVFDESVYVAGSIYSNYGFVINSIGTSMMMNEYTTTLPSNTLTFTFTDIIPTNDYIGVYLQSYYAPILDTSGNYFQGGAFVVGGEGNNVIDLSSDSMYYYYNADTKIFGNGGNDTIIGGSGVDYIIAGEGADTVYQSPSWGSDTVDFTETTKAVDTFVIETECDWSNGPDTIIGFDVSGTTTNDRLNMFSNNILANTTGNVDGIDSNLITQHSSAGGIVTFKDASGNEIVINDDNGMDAISYLQSNLAVGTVAAFNFDTDMDGTADSLVVFGQTNRSIESVGVFLDQVTGVTLGKTAGTNVVQIVDTTAPMINNAETTSNGLNLFFSENLASVNMDGWSLLKNGVTDMGTNSFSITDNVVTVATSTSLLSTDYVLARPTTPGVNIATDMVGNTGMYADMTEYAIAIGGSGNNVIDLSGLPVTSLGFSALGNEGDDTITGSKYNDYINGGDGNDKLLGGAGDDELIGGDGNDILNGGTGYDTMYGGAGDDIYFIDGSYHGDTVYENANEGTDTILSFVSTAIMAENVENLQIITKLASNAYGNTLDNVIAAGAGNNILDGGEGKDTASYALSKAAVTVSLATTMAQNTGGSGYDTLYNFEKLMGSGYADTLTGDDNANTLSGNGGNDILDGGAGSDIIFGNGGNDTVMGGDGNDFLFGGLGNDVIYGGAGNDKLTGAGGNDFFVFNTALGANNIDTIADFSAPADTIRLENSIFTKLTSTGTLSAANFVANTTGKAVDANDYIIYETDTGKLFYDADGSGAGAAVQFALLGVTTHPTNVTAADFVVI